MMYKISRKRLIELRDARIERLLREQKETEERMAQQEREALRDQIMNPTQMV
jgi:hypothetical protein